MFRSGTRPWNLKPGICKKIISGKKPLRDDQTIIADYLFENGSTMNYIMNMQNGNLISDQVQSSTGGNETGTYAYDSNINPEFQLRWPDILFTNISKNNRKSGAKDYTGLLPISIPYKFEYNYNEDGYPAESFVSYKSYYSQQHQHEKFTSIIKLI